MSAAVTRVLRVLTRPNVGGPLRHVRALAAEDARLGVEGLLVVGELAAGETTDLDRAGSGVVVVPAMGRAVAPLQDLRATKALRRVIRDFQPDVVHTHTSKAGALGRRAAWAEQVPLVAHTFHGHVLRDYFSRPTSILLARLEARLARRTDLLLAVSESCAQELAGLGVGEGRIRVEPPAIELRGFLEHGGAAARQAARQRLGLDGSTPVLAFVGRLESVKQPELFGPLVASLPDAVGLVCGTGSRSEDVARTSDRVRMLGAVRELAEVLCAADVLVMCSRREGLPFAAVEAMACGLPVVGFDVPGVQDVLLRHDPQGLVDPAAGVAGLVAAVSRALARGRVAVDPTAFAEVSPARVARRHLELYDDARLG